MRAYSSYTRDAIRLLGRYIQLGRKARKLTQQSLADRVGITRATLQKIENGDLKCEIGIVFEAAAIVGVKLFDVETQSSFSAKLESVEDKLALLPKSVRHQTQKVDDDF